MDFRFIIIILIMGYLVEVTRTKESACDNQQCLTCVTTKNCTFLVLTGMTVGFCTKKGLQSAIKMEMLDTRSCSRYAKWAVAKQRSSKALAKSSLGHKDYPKQGVVHRPNTIPTELLTTTSTTTTTTTTTILPTTLPTTTIPPTTILPITVPTTTITPTTILPTTVPTTTITPTTIPTTTTTTTTTIPTTILPSTTVAPITLPPTAIPLTTISTTTTIPTTIPATTISTKLPIPNIRSVGFINPIILKNVSSYEKTNPWDRNHTAGFLHMTLKTRRMLSEAKYLDQKTIVSLTPQLCSILLENSTAPRVSQGDLAVNWFCNPLGFTETSKETMQRSFCRSHTNAERYLKKTNYRDTDLVKWNYNNPMAFTPMYCKYLNWRQKNCVKSQKM